MLTTREITHHVYTHSEISNSYIFVGAVTHAIPKDDPLDDEVNMHWMIISNEVLRHVDAQSEVVPYITECKCIDHYISTSAVTMNNINELIYRFNTFEDK